MKTKLLKKLRKQAKNEVRVIRDGLGYQIQYMFYKEWHRRNYTIKTYDEAVEYYYKEVQSQLEQIVWHLRQLNPKIVKIK